MMYAKLIIYQQESNASPYYQLAINESVNPITTHAHYPCWELTADNLTTGKIAELLLCLDELGFSDEALPPNGSALS